MEMTRLELLTLLYSLQALVESGNIDKAKEVMEKVIKEAERAKEKQQPPYSERPLNEGNTQGSYLPSVLCLYYTIRQEKMEEKKKIGRPTENPKTHETRIRMSDEDMDKLNFCCDRLGKTKADIIRLGISKLYEEIKEIKIS